jgi:hypothetical protein
LVDTATYSKVTFVTSSLGGARAIDDLGGRIETRRRLHGDGALPVVELVSAPWTTRFGVKVRPAFKIVEWFGASAQAQVGITPLQAQIEAKPASADSSTIKESTAVKKSMAADMDDEIPF